MGEEAGIASNAKKAETKTTEPNTTETQTSPAPPPTEKNVTPNEAPPQKKEANISLKKMKTSAISSDISKLVNEIKKKDEDLKRKTIEWKLITVATIWNAYVDTVESQSTKNALATAIINLKGDNVIEIIVPNKINQETVRAEMKLIEQLRDSFPKKELIFDIKVDIDSFPEYEKQEMKKSLSPTEKLQLLTKKNPFIGDLIKKLDLKIDK